MSFGPWPNDPGLAIQANQLPGSVVLDTRGNTRGDTLAFNPTTLAFERVAVGADGTVLTADSTFARGVKWVPAPGSAVTSVFARSGAVVAVAGDYTAAQVTNAADKSSAAQQAFTGELQTPDLVIGGLTGAVAASRYVGATTTGSPASGTFAVGDFVIAQNGHVFICTVAGTPGTWVDAGGAAGAVTSVFTRTGAVVAAAGDYTAAQVTNAADKSSASQQNFTGELKTPDLVVAGLTGAVAASRYVGATTTGSPASGTFAVGDFVIAQNGHVFICTVAGTPGTWVDAGGAAGAVTSVFTRTGAVVAASADYTAAQVTNAADKSSASQQNFTGELKTPDLVVAGLTGAVAASRYVGATTTGSPASGTFAVGDFVIAQNGHVFICTVAGTPGTWVDAGSAGAVTSVFTRTGAVVAASGDYTAAQVTNAADKSSASQQNFTGELKTPDLVVAGITGATAASRYVGATTSGAPSTGTFAVGDFIVDQSGAVWVCTVAGTPGTWVSMPAIATGHVASDQTNTAVAMANVAGMSFAIPANQTWTFEMNLFVVMASGSGIGQKFALTGPAAPTLVSIQFFGNAGSATAFQEETVTAFATNTANNYMSTGSINGIVRITGIIVNGANAGTVQLQNATSTAATGATTKAGSYFVARKSS